MVKVKDTQHFVTRARSIHGERFDYSESVYVNNKAPITFKCNQCGRSVTCRACDHARHTKYIGCRCYAQNKAKCKDCGAPRPRKLRFRCKACHAWFMWAKASRNAFYRKQKRLKVLKSDPVLKWAALKSTTLRNNRRVNKANKASKPIEVSTWEQWSHECRKHSSMRSEETGWVKRARRWRSSLTTRSQQGVN